MSLYEMDVFPLPWMLRWPDLKRHACVGKLGEVELGEHVEHGRHVVLDQKPAWNEQDDALVA